MTGYVATRWYRAPEIMLNWRHYNGKAGKGVSGFSVNSALFFFPLLPLIIYCIPLSLLYTVFFKLLFSSWMIIKFRVLYKPSFIMFWEFQIELFIQSISVDFNFTVFEKIYIINSSTESEYQYFTA